MHPKNEYAVVTFSCFQLNHYLISTMIWVSIYCNLSIFDKKKTSLETTNGSRDTVYEENIKEYDGWADKHSPSENRWKPIIN